MASSIYSSGIEPGFGCDLLAIAMASMSNRIYSIRGLEITDYSRDNTVYEMRELVRFRSADGLSRRNRDARGDQVRLGRGGHHGRQALGVQLDEIRESCEFAPAPRRLETLSGVIEPGAVAAVWFRCIGVVDGHEVITIEHVDRMAEDVAPGSAEEPRRRHRRRVARDDRRRAQLRCRIRNRLQFR